MTEVEKKIDTSSILYFQIHKHLILLSHAIIKYLKTKNSKISENLILF